MDGNALLRLMLLMSSSRYFQNVLWQCCMKKQVAVDTQKTDTHSVPVIHSCGSLKTFLIGLNLSSFKYWTSRLTLLAVPMCLFFDGDSKNMLGIYLDECSAAQRSSALIMKMAADSSGRGYV